jgi:hypothetical protein
MLTSATQLEEGERLGTRTDAHFHANRDAGRRPKPRRTSREIAGVLFFTLLGFLVMGYHPGLEDDAIYLPAVKARLNPALYPWNANFFKLQMQATQFDVVIADFVRWTHMPLAWAELLWQLACLFLILWAVKRIANRLFAEETARWAGVALVAAMFTLPVAGTALYMVDQHLHPRNLATAAILLAVSRILDGKRRQAAALLLAAFLMHPLMAAMGISFCFFLTMAMLDSVRVRVLRWRNSLAAAVPLGWVFEPADPAWRKALDTRTYYYLYKWTWYEWLGALAPLFLFWLLWRLARKPEEILVAGKQGETVLARFALAVCAYGVFHQALAMLMLCSPALVRLTPLQPMRYLHVVYFLFMLTAGCLLGKYALKRSAWRWALFLLAVNGCMLAAQRAELRSSPHLELPGGASANPWLQAFAWIRANTPQDAYFALDPETMEAPGEDYHGFRALAERSQLADAVKDAAVVTQVPELGPVWARQVEAERGWRNFRLADFERLKAEFGVDWVLVEYPQPEGLACQWHNGMLAVCKIP